MLRTDIGYYVDNVTYKRHCAAHQNSSTINVHKEMARYSQEVKYRFRIGS